MSKTSSTFQLQSLPPTSSAAKYHSLRIYYADQEWLGNMHTLNPTDWGWKVQDETITPVLTDLEIAPDRVLRIVSCGCKKACQMWCKCRKAGLFCTSMCSTCIGQICANSCPPDADDTEDLCFD